MSVFWLKVIICFFIFPAFCVPLIEAEPRIPETGLRSFYGLFPLLTESERQMAFSEEGLKNTFTKNERQLIIPASNSGIDLLGTVMEKTPTVLIEALFMIPHSEREFTRLDAYNALGRIEKISSYTVFSPSRGGYIALFEESIRLENGNRNRPIPDPPPATILPSSETVYICLRDAFFGNTYFRGNFSAGIHGITYSLTNNTAIRFLVFPVMGAEKFPAILYVEPLAEGMLVYGIAGIDIPEFIASRINLAFQIDRRVTLLINWLRDGLK